MAPLALTWGNELTGSPGRVPPEVEPHSPAARQTADLVKQINGAKGIRAPDLLHAKRSDIL
jgi:hypothetical protein